MRGYDIYFGLKSQRFFELSPYYFCTYEVSKRKWRTLIHYWCASYFSNNLYLYEDLRNADTPEKAIFIAKRYGLKDFDQCDSRKILYSIQERFNQSDSLRSALLSTGESTLIYTGGGYMGEGNRYGRVLMGVREIYATE